MLHKIAWLISLLLLDYELVLPGTLSQKPIDLQCEFCTNPISIDQARPRLSWKYSSTAYNWRQKAYQIRVAGDARCRHRIYWDSGRVPSDQSHLVEYQGIPLTSARRYWWQVRVWNQDDECSSWSDPAFFETALLHPSDWRARWITFIDSAPLPLRQASRDERPPAKWIASNLSTRNYIRKSFFIPAGHRLTSALLYIQADNTFDLFINGKSVSIPADSAFTPVNRLLQNGENVIAILHYQTDHPAWFMSALRARLDIEFANAPTVSVATDSSWKIVYFDFGENHPQKFSANDWANISFKETAAWRAPGICQDIHPRWTRRSHYFRKIFHLQEKPISARMYISSRGVYEPYLNGKKISNEWLAPGVSGKVQPYRSYDVLHRLKKGNNGVGVLVGGGWWNGEGHSFLYSKKPQVLVQLFVRFKNGQESWIVSDSTWQAHPSPVLEDALMNGERYDARQEIPDWCLPVTDARSWSPVHVVNAKDSSSTALLPSNLDHLNHDKPLVSQAMPPVTISEERSAVEVSEPVPGKYIFDFGQNASGRCRLKVSGASPGTPITIRYGEKLNADGTLNIDVYRDVWFRGDNDRISPFNTKNIDHYICRGGGLEYWQPRFTYTGFRYAELSGYPGKPPADALVHMVFHNDLARSADFSCSNPLLNTLWQNTNWTLRSNMHYIPTDCPTREKHPWNGDMQVFAPTACWQMDMSRFLATWTAGGPKLGLGAVGWEDEELIVPLTLYHFYGDRRILEKKYPDMVQIVERRIKEGGDSLFTGASRYWCWSDHISLEQTPRDFFSALFYYHSVSLLARVADVLGYETDCAHYSAMLTPIAQAIHDRYYHADSHTYSIGNQGALVLPLAFGITPPQAKEPVVRSLLKDIFSHQDHLTTGFVTTAELLPVLSENGAIETAFRLATRTDFPSWGYLVGKGATTIWESWHEEGSANHFALGSICRWFMEYLAGIRPYPDQPGFKHIIFKPVIPATLQNVRAVYRSPYGPIVSSWQKSSETLTWNVTIPANTTATICFPVKNLQHVSRKGRAWPAEPGRIADETPARATVQTGSGEYTFTMPIKHIL